MVDPRISIIDQRMKRIGKIVAVSSGKGGVGKSLVASVLALTLANRGCRAGLFDLDFTSPSAHVILDVEDIRPREEKGIIPPEVHGLQFMSIIYYSGDHVTPLRGADVSNSLIELLSVTRWKRLDYLVLDMPPGIGDVTLDLIRLVKNVRFLIITTSSQLAFQTVKKLTNLLRTLKIPVLGIVENMKTSHSNAIRRQTRKLGLTFLGEIPYDPKVEEAIGRTDKIRETIFAKKVEQITSRI